VCLAPPIGSAEALRDLIEGGNRRRGASEQKYLSVMKRAFSFCPRTETKGNEIALEQGSGRIDGKAQKTPDATGSWGW